MKIKQQSLPEQMYEYIMNGIVTGKLDAGMKLSEETLCEQSGISRTPVREALLMLERDGMLVRKPRCGFYVRTFEAEEIEELYQCRQMLECTALDLGFEHIPREKLEKLEELIDQDLQNPNAESSMKVDEKMHKLIVDSCPNRYMQELVGQLVQRTRPFRLIRSYSSDDISSISTERKNIIVAIKSGHKTLAMELLGNHIYQGRGVIES